MLIHSLNRLEKPSYLPITVKEAKLYLKIDHDIEDLLIEDMIKAAVNSFEDVTATALIPQVWKVIYKDIDRNIIDIPIKPVANILNISTINSNHQISKITNYTLINNSLFFNISFPSQILIIEFQAGTEINFIPENIKLSLLEHIAFLYENRGENNQFDLNIYSKFRTIKY